MILSTIFISPVAKIQHVQSALGDRARAAVEHMRYTTREENIIDARRFILACARLVY